MTDSSPVWTPDLGDKLGETFGDEIWDIKGAGIFSISLLGEKIRHECARSFHVTSRPTGETIKGERLDECVVLTHWKRLESFVRSERY
ncbi:hypothetical protein AVEN_78140-1 [Araneus ventricosus]|uniref:Uncharacterized protein n=1 Tax=Araneus ventricosus TaxID=182803 RepID=A0A4Y2RW24_ARAVE|nr:hypothetical protein AVEN_169244-1 [Araneus ventricosus]GBN79714.1 hypothetical protein AVEN_212817-1 [Araneus ventricosus]GBN79749.1 hypothetical protein AVEN_46539-1 [Araneus ventricosus]GBN79773.1 hypothetical protein AVEN_78140-1 [Araneus ventricosus]